MNLKKNKIGILGGSFDPAHKGHLAISKEAAKKFKLNQIIWAITKKNPFKKKSNLSLSTRIKYCKKITKETSFIKIKFLENKIKVHSDDEVPSISEDKGSFNLPLTLYGGRFGKLPETPIDEFANDDGLQDQVEGGLSLELRYESGDHNTYRMHAEIK